MSRTRSTWPVVAVSAAGVLFILLGLVALALWIGIPFSIGLWRLTRRDVG